MYLIHSAFVLLVVLAAPAAKAAYTANADGTVTDTTTGLVWDQCLLGSRTGAVTSCATNTNATYTWANALAEVSARNMANHLGFGDWRLPNVNELESIVKRDTHSPAVDGTAFSGTPASGWAWTSTTYAADPASALIVDFFFGGIYANVKSDSNYVRLVRSGQSFSSFDVLLPVVNGSCGSAHATTPLVTTAPSANLCTSGSATSVTSGTGAYTWGCNGSNGGSTASCSASRGYTVTPGVASGVGTGSILPHTPQVVAYNATLVFEAMPVMGYAVQSWAGSCGGSAVGADNVTFFTNAITSDCTVVVSFPGNDSTPDAFAFTPANNVAQSTQQTSNTITVSGLTMGAPISVTGGEYQIGNAAFNSMAGTVNNGDTVTVRHTSSAAYSAATTTTLTIGGVDGTFTSTTLAAPVNGTCGIAHSTSLVTSTPNANLCTTGTATSVTSGNSAYTWGCNGSNGGSSTAANACSASRGYTVTPSAGANGSISPNTAQVVAYNTTPAFTANPSGGFGISTWSGSCGGTASGSGNANYTTNAITANCTVTASFAASTSYVAPSPAGGGNITAQLSGGGATCGLQTVGYQAASAVGVAPPAGVTFPNGVVSFTTTNSCTVGGAITVTLTYPSDLPAGTRFWKYGPSAVGQPSTWYVHPATIVGNTITYSVTDNGQGDSNATSGQITDPAGAALGGSTGIAGVPTLSQWAMLLLVGLMGMATFWMTRRRADAVA